MPHHLRHGARIEALEGDAPAVRVGAGPVEWCNSATGAEEMTRSAGAVAVC